MKLFGKFYKYLEEYCKNSMLSYDKIVKSPKCGNNDRLLILRVDYERAKLYRPDKDRPAEILLSVTANKDGSFTVVEGENAQKYLYKTQRII